MGLTSLRVSGIMVGAVAAGVIAAAAMPADAAIYQVEVTGTVKSGYINPADFNYQVSDGSQFTVAFNLDTEAPSISQDGATYSQSSTQYSFVSGSYTASGIAPLITTVYKDAAGNIAGLYVSLRDETALATDPVGYLIMSGWTSTYIFDNNNPPKVFAASLGELAAKGTLTSLDFDWASQIATGSITTGQKLYASFGTVTFTLVPEPASLGLMGVGALAILRRRRNLA